MDFAHEWTDEQLRQLEERMTKEYLQAAREMHAKQQKELARYSKERSERLKALDDTPAARREYKQWLQSQAVNQERMQAMVSQLSDGAMRANEKAVAMARNILPTIYTENANMAAFSIDKAIKHDTRFALVDEDTVRHLMGLGEHDQLIHEVIDMGPARERIQSLSKTFPKTNMARDIQWNRQKFTSAITQGILQGESVPNIVKRTDMIFGSNRAAAVRAARTACTSAENAGRVSSYERADALGIPLIQEWMATLDMRTRESHKAADGQQVEVGEPFIVGGVELEYPGDPAGEPAEVYNCRCTLRARVKGFEEKGERWARLPDDMTYEEWKASKPVTRAESYMNADRRVSAEWYSNRALKAESAAEGIGGGGFAVDELHPESIGGVKRTSEAMSFDDANELRGNPRYDSSKEINEAMERLRKAKEKENRLYEDLFMTGNADKSALAKIQEKIRKTEIEIKRLQEDAVAYKVNCQTCVVANEARRRGYDVMATGNFKGSINDRVSRKTNMAWIDPKTGTHPDYIRYSGAGAEDFRGRPIPTRTSYWKWLNSDGIIEEGNRYTIEFNWKGNSRSGHIVNLERVNGELRLYDPQNGKTYIGQEVGYYLKDVKYSATSYGTKYALGPEILRVDNMRFNDDIIDQLLEARR